MGLESVIAKYLHQVVFLSQPSGIPSLILDCSLSETHKREAKPTQFETEVGQTISDHIVLGPFSLHIQGMVSNAPLSTLAGIASAALTTVATAQEPNPGVLGAKAAAIAALPLFTQALSNPAATNYDILLALQAARAPLTVVTSLKLYINMWLTTISVPREAKNGGGLVFDVDLTQLLLVTPITVDISKLAIADLAAAEADKGAQEAENELTGDFLEGVADAPLAP